MNPAVPEISVSEVKNYRLDFVLLEMIEHLFVIIVAYDGVLI